MPPDAEKGENNMNKMTAIMAAIALSATATVGLYGCGGEKEGEALKVFAPDGAPALSVARLYEGELAEKFDINIVDANTIQTYVSGENAQADIAIMPVNAAVKLLGNGDKYKMLGTVTHGNLYILKKATGEEITSSNLSSLVGKTVGVINLANVPGLTFKAILADNDLEFNELKDGAEAASDKVNLKAIDAAEAVPSNADCDYFVVPEPAASTKVSATGGKLSFAGDLQELYEGGEGYPQAVAVAKTSVSADDITAFIDTFDDTKTWLMDVNTSAETIVSAVNSLMYKADYVSTLTANTLTRTVIENSGIGFVTASESKADVLAYMSKINSVASSSFGTPTDAFFYTV